MERLSAADSLDDIVISVRFPLVCFVVGEGSVERMKWFPALLLILKHRTTARLYFPSEENHKD